MSKILNRRAMLSGTATVLAAATTAITGSQIMAATSQPITNDAKLLAQLKRWQASADALKAQGDALTGDEPNYDELQDAFDAAVKAHDAVTFEALGEPATTHAGLMAKAKLIEEQGVFDQRNGFQDLMEAAGQALLADLVAVSGGLAS